MESIPSSTTFLQSSTSTSCCWHRRCMNSERYRISCWSPRTFDSVAQQDAVAASGQERPAQYHLPKQKANNEMAQSFGCCCCCFCWWHAGKPKENGWDERSQTNIYPFPVCEYLWCNRIDAMCQCVWINFRNSNNESNAFSSLFS